MSTKQKPAAKPSAASAKPKSKSKEAAEPRWLLLIHQIPVKPAYFRVKVWRRLQRLGAVTIKNTVYALPLSETALEDFQWVAREIVEAGGEASICEARLIHGLRDSDVESMFNQARDADYRALSDELRPQLEKVKKRPPTDETKEVLIAELARAKKHFAEIAGIDFFSSSGREATHSMISSLEAKLAGAPKKAPGPRAKKAASPESLVGRTWVTRRGIFVDRIASAWLIRRFIDPRATFKWVNGKSYQPEAGELRFDMFEAEFTHIGDRCTFEVLLERAGFEDRALQPIAEIVHDIDIKDQKYGREQAAGVESLLAGIASSSEDDDQRLARGGAVFDDLYEFFRRKRS